MDVGRGAIPMGAASVAGGLGRASFEVSGLPGRVGSSPDPVTRRARRRPLMAGLPSSLHTQRT